MARTGTRRLLAVVAAVALVAVAATGCGRIAEQATKSAIEKATGTKVNEKTGEVTIQGKDGKSVTISGGETSKLPEGMPDFPVYAADVKSSAKSESDGKTSFIVNMQSSDDVKTIYDWYQKELKAAGWTIKNATLLSADTPVGTISAEKGGSSASVSIVPDSSDKTKTGIGIMLDAQ